MKKTLMILTIGLFFGTIGYTSTAMAANIQDNDVIECNDKGECTKKDCCKKKAEDKAENKTTETKKDIKTAEVKSCTPKEGEKKACCADKDKKKS